MTAARLQTFECASPEDTDHLARRIAAVLDGVYVSLEGDLGAGKTHFTRALAAALGVEGPVTSPTFVLQKLYDVPDHPRINQLAHYDFYRIADYTELLDMGFEDHSGTTLVLAEWGNLFVSEFPGTPVRIRFEVKSNDSRLISISGLSVPVSL